MDDNEYSSRDELDIELDGQGAIEVDDSSDDDVHVQHQRPSHSHAPRTLAGSSSRQPSRPRTAATPSTRVDEWRQAVEGEPDADDEMEGAGVIDLQDSSDDESARDPEDPTVLAEQDQDGMNELRIPIQSLASALGGYEDVAMEDGTVVETYVPGDDCLGCLRDLRKLWRRDDDDPSRKVARVYAEVNLMGNDLIPIVLATVGRSEQGHKIALAVMDLITSMTWPIHVEAEARAAHEHGENLDLLLHLAALEKAQQEYKALIIRSSDGQEEGKNLLRIMVHDLLVPALMTPRISRTERHTGTISMCMHLVRNLLELRDPMAPTNASPEAVERSRAQSRLVGVLDSSNFLDVLLMICSTSAEDKSFDPWAPVATECVHHMYIGTSVRAVAGFWHDWEDPLAVEGQDPEGVEAQRVANERRAQLQHQLAQSLFAEDKVKRTHQLQVGARHPKFGTTIAYHDSNGRHRIARNPSALRKSVTQLQTEVEKRDKRRPPRRRRAVVEPGGVVSKPPWTSEAVIRVRRWADRFVQQGFTPLTKVMWTAIRGEQAAVGNVDMARLRMIQLGTWFLDYFLTRRSMYGDMLTKRSQEQLEAEKKKQQDKDDLLLFPELDHPSSPSKPKTENAPLPLEEAWDFSDIFEWTKPWALRLVFVRTMETMEFKAWLEFNAVVNLWTMLFRTMDALSRSTREEDRTVGEVAQEQVFYDREMLKQCRSIMGAFKSQSVATLNAIEAFTYTMPKLLERFSQGKEYMYVRARDKARTHKTQEEQDDLADQHRAFKEQAFTFVSFQRELATKPIASTAIQYLERWPDFTTDHQLEMVVHVMHRLAIKCNNPGLFFGNKERELIVKFSDPEQVAQLEAIAPKASRDLKKLVAYLQRKWNKLSSEEQEAYRSGRRAPRPPKPAEEPRELIVRGARPVAEKFSIAAAVLIEQQKLGVLTWLITGLQLAYSQREREAVFGDLKERNDRVAAVHAQAEMETQDPQQQKDRVNELMKAMPESNTDLANTASAPWELRYDGDTELESWASSNPEVQLLLRLAGLEPITDEVDESRPWKWLLPSDVNPNKVKETIELLQEAISHPFRTEDGQPVRKLLMKKPVRSARPQAAMSGDEYIRDMIVPDASGSDSPESDASASVLERRMTERAKQRAAQNGTRATSTKRTAAPKKKKRTTAKQTVRRAASLDKSDVSIDSEEELAAIEALMAKQHSGSRASSASSHHGKSPFDRPDSDGDASTSPPPLTGPARTKRRTGLFLGSDDDDDVEMDQSDRGASEDEQSAPTSPKEAPSLFRASASPAPPSPAPPQPTARTPSIELSPGAAKRRERAEKEAALRAALLAEDDEEEFDQDDSQQVQQGVPEPVDKAVAGLKRSWERHMSLEDRPSDAEAAYAPPDSVLDKVPDNGLFDGFGSDQEVQRPTASTERKRRAVPIEEDEDE